jgi:hypothetical protein
MIIDNMLTPLLDGLNPCIPEEEIVQHDLQLILQLL